MIKVAVFDTKPYDKASFLAAAEGQDDLHMTFFETKLDADTVGLADGFDCVVIFVNDTADKAVIDHLYAHGVRLIALRCAGFNQVDVKAAFEKIHVVRVPAYSPYAIAEHAMAMLLTSVRRIHTTGQGNTISALPGCAGLICTARRLALSVPVKSVVRLSISATVSACAFWRMISTRIIQCRRSLSSRTNCSVKAILFRCIVRSQKRTTI